MMTWEQYLLVCLMEECAEVQQAAAKSLRFGLDDIKPGTTTSNYEKLVYEFTDVVAIIGMLDEAGVTFDVCDKQAKRKVAKVKKYAQLSVDNGVLPCPPNKT